MAKMFGFQRDYRQAVLTEEFERMVHENAYYIWRDKEADRSHRNWCDAWSQLSAELGCFPPVSEINQRARELWLARKDAQAVEDWLEAQRRVALSFVVVT